MLAILGNQEDRANVKHAFLEEQGRDRFAGFVRGLKEGQSTVEALADSYDGMALSELERAWRGWVADRMAGDGDHGNQ